MALHTELPIYKVTYDLAMLAATLTRNMPRDFRSLYGRMLTNLVRRRACGESPTHEGLPMSTKIEWTDETWNPVTGCTKVSQGCKNCYAERLWPKVSAAEAKREGWDKPRAFPDVRCHPERLEAPLHWKKPRRIFVNSMSDLFHEDVPFIFIDRVFAVMALCPQHTFQILTKRPERMREYMN